MKLFTTVLLSICTYLLTACNPGVFIEDFMPSSQEITLTQEKAEVNFKSDNWAVLWIMKDSPVSSHPVQMSCSDLEGRETKYLPLKEKELAVISVGTETCDFGIEKRDTKKLEFIRGENMGNDTALYIIEVGNGFERKYIDLFLPPTPKYKIDSVVYQWDKFSYSDDIVQLVESSGITVDNSKGAEPVTVFVRPYEYAQRDIKRYLSPEWSEERISRIFGKGNALISIPDTKDGKPESSNTKIDLSESFTRIDTDLDKKFEIPVIIPGGEKKRLEVFLCIMEYSLPFKVYVSNPLSGRRRVVSGDIHSQKPFNHLILKKTQNDDADN